MTIKSTHGRFSSDGTSYQITDPRTPRPWSNVICNGRFGLVVSQNGGGFSWLDNSQLNVLTRWEMDLVEDRAGKHLYLHDLDSGATWSASPSPCRVSYDEYLCTHTMGSTTFEVAHQDIATKWTLSVAPDAQVEVWTLEITNRSDSVRRIRTSSYMEWCCGVAPDSKREFHRLFISSEYDAKRQEMSVGKVMWDVPDRTEADHWNREWPYAAAHAVVTDQGDFTPFAMGDKERFIGHGTREAPDGLAKGGVTDESFGRFTDSAASLGGDLTLQPGETRRIAFLLGASDNKITLRDEMDQFRSIDAAFDVAPAAKQRWLDLLSATEVETGIEDFDLMNNCWLRYQAISARLWGRTGYYQQSGAFGYRDQLQDSQVWLPIEPSRCRDQILLHATKQFTDGSVYHWWHPLSHVGNHTSCSDDYLWLPFLTVNYLKETGDYAILEERTPYLDGGDDTLLDHCFKSIHRAFERTTERGLPHIGACDWNDGLSSCGLDGKGESIWLAFFLKGVLDGLADVLEASDGSAERINELREKSMEYAASIEEHAWDGEWYRRATRDDGGWLGSAENDVGKIYLNPQTWSILTETGGQDRRDQAWQSVKTHLLRDMGPLLLAPAYSVPDRGVGYITRYTPGSRENGGVYMHAAVWALAAACKLKDRKAATDIWNSISPPRRGSDASHYRAEPFVTPGNVDGPDSATPGSAGWTWYTGSAAWLNRVSLQHVLGIRPELDGLHIDPCPLEGMTSTRTTRKWRGYTLSIEIDATSFVPGAAPNIMINGNEHDSSVITENALSANGADTSKPVSVEVSWDQAPSAEIKVTTSDRSGVNV